MLLLNMLKNGLMKIKKIVTFNVKNSLIMLCKLNKHTEIRMYIYTDI